MYSRLHHEDITCDTGKIKAQSLLLRSHFNIDYYLQTAGRGRNDMLNQNETCPTCSDSKAKGYVYAFLTALTCPCHLPLVGIFLGTSAAGAFFAQYFVLLAISMGVLSLILFVAAVRVLL